MYVCSLPVSFVNRVIMRQYYAFSVCQYVAQFYSMPASMHRCIKWAYQKLCKAPYNAVPHALLINLKEFGFPFQFPSPFLSCPSRSPPFSFLFPSLSLPFSFHREGRTLELFRVVCRLPQGCNFVRALCDLLSLWHAHSLV